MAKRTQRAVLIAVVAFLAGAPPIAQAQYLGQFSANPYAPNSTANQFGNYGSPYSPDSVNNSFGRLGSPYSPNSATNPYATNAPKLYDQAGNYRGRLSANPYSSDSVSNRVGRYGSPYSPDSVNDAFGAGSPYRPDSPNNRFGSGWAIEGQH